MSRPKITPTAAVTIATLLFLYFPIAVLVFNSFNASRFSSSWEGWTLKWYRILFSPVSRDLWEAFQRSLVIAGGASLISMALGTLAAWVIHLLG